MTQKQSDEYKSHKGYSSVLERTTDIQLKMQSCNDLSTTYTYSHYGLRKQSKYIYNEGHNNTLLQSH